uniref:ABC transporter domain-containing protein n=1 Tax=Odontella aurita TaxID=265563 RepID=A0A7S4IZL3_9STRA|mmetsp:Transcript_33937/g.101264  ORF Transcript_33937/g.101264 Transcript_33937/m.101264 type:complete len:733 (+) Transcript_33937:327-2525(+)
MAPELSTAMSETNDATPVPLASRPLDIETGHEEHAAAAGARADALDEAKRGKLLRWSRITKEVEVKESTSGLLRGSIAAPNRESRSSFVKRGVPSVKKTILNEVSGCAEPGSVMALMGPSGSGKTSILDVLSGRGSYDGGTITLDGEIVTDRVMKKMKKKIAYVKQSDLFFGHLTVRDQLTYTAFLRLPSSWTKPRKLAEVDRIIKQLRLAKCADTPIFMVSGGEKKRVNIGSELLTDPSIVLLDEPTSGLDSTSAVALMRILERLAKRAGKTIITSIHQPSSAVFFGFDKLMLLADGNVAYFGTPAGSLEHARSLGMACPDGYNAADHWMDLLVVDSAAEEEDDDDMMDDTFRDDGDGGGGRDSWNDNEAPGAMRRMKKRALGAAAQDPGVSNKQKLISAWDGEAVASKIDDEFALARRASSAMGSDDGGEGLMSGTGGGITLEKSFNSSWWTQFTVLVHRSMKNSRSAIFTKMNLIKAGAIGVMCGLLWFQMPYTEATVFDRSSYYFFTMTFWVFDAMFTAYMAFPLERSIIFKERSSGAYHLSAYFMAKTVSEAPARLVLPLIYMCTSYWLGAINNNFGIFLGSTLCSLLSVLAGESIGLFMGAAVLDMEKGMVVMTVTALALMVVGGFFVRTIPKWVQWLGYLSPFKYSYNSSVQLVFDRPVPCDGSGLLSVCEGADTGTASIADVLSFLGVEGSPGFNVGLLLVIFVFMRIFAFLALKGKKAGEREM